MKKFIFNKRKKLHILSIKKEEEETGEDQATWVTIVPEKVGCFLTQSFM